MNENPELNQEQISELSAFDSNVPNEAPDTEAVNQTVDTTTNVDKGKSSFNRVASLFDFVEILAFSILAVLLVFTLLFRVCRVDGGSMNNTLKDGETIIISDVFYEPKQGDIVVFHLCQGEQGFNQPLIKRVIALEGQTVLINITSGDVYVDGVKLTESYAYFKSEGYSLSYFDLNKIDRTEDGNLTYEVTVPEGHIFVMGDNRNGSTDSRSSSVGFVNEDTILGKALFRVAPFTIFK